MPRCRSRTTTLVQLDDAVPVDDSVRARRSRQRSPRCRRRPDGGRLQRSTALAPAAGRRRVGRALSTVMRRSRSRPLAVVIAFALLVMPVAAFVIVVDRELTRARPSRATRAVASCRPPPTASAYRREAITGFGRPARLVAARSSARDFVTEPRVFGPAWPIGAIAHAAPTLLRAIAREPVRVTPAREQHPPLLRALSVVAQTGGTLRAVATLLTTSWMVMSASSSVVIWEANDPTTKGVGAFEGGARAPGAASPFPGGR